MTARIHLACDGTWYDYDAGEYEQIPACGNDFHGRKRLTTDPAQITCAICRAQCDEMWPALDVIVPLVETTVRDLGDGHFRAEAA